MKNQLILLVVCGVLLLGCSAESEGQEIASVVESAPVVMYDGCNSCAVNVAAPVYEVKTRNRMRRRPLASWRCVGAAVSAYFQCSAQQRTQVTRTRLLRRR